MSKTLIVYYSRTGTTKKLAEKLKKQLKADIDEIKDLRNRTGALGYMVGGKDSTMKNLTEIKFTKNPEKYSLVILGTPIWAWNITPAIRTYIKENKTKIKKLAFFCTMGGQGNESAEKEITKILKKPIACLAVKTQDINKCDKEVKKFVKELR